MVDFTGGTWRSLVDGAEISAIPDSEVDSFEQYEPGGDNNLSDNYFGDTGNFEIHTDSDPVSPIYDSTQSLHVEESDGTNVAIGSQTGLDNYPEVGDTFELYVYIQDATEENRAMAWYAVQDSSFSTRPDDAYALRFDFSENVFELTRMENGNFNTVFDESVTWTDWDGDWLHVEVDWQNDGDHDILVEDLDETEIVSASANDDTFSDGGIGFGINSSGGDTLGMNFDNWFIL